MKQIINDMSLPQKVWLGFLALLFFGLNIFSFSFVDLTNFDYNTVIYIGLVFLVLVAIGIIGGIKIVKENNEHKVVRFVTFFVTLFVVFFCVILFADYKSSDYIAYLSEWVKTYSGLSFRDCLINITNISNYPQIYNYFLIIIAKLNINSLYAIKFSTLLFSLLLCFTMELIVSYIRGTKFNFVRFALFMLLPMILIEYTMWAQCDAIYVTFSLLAFYFALRHKSKLSFVMVGLAFANKLQFLFIVPILFIMLIVKDRDGAHYLKWKYLYLAPLMYVINLVPILFGADVLDTILVYFIQTGYYGRLSQNCANFCLVFDLFGIDSQSKWYLPALITCVIVTFAIMIVLIVFVVKFSKNKTLSGKDFVFFAFVFSFIMPFFMPKMLDRFFYMACCFGVIFACIDRQKDSFFLSVFCVLSLFFVLYVQFAITEQWIYYSYPFLMIIGLIFNLITLYKISNYIIDNYVNISENSSLNNKEKTKIK